MEGSLQVRVLPILRRTASLGPGKEIFLGGSAGRPLGKGGDSLKPRKKQKAISKKGQIEKTGQRPLRDRNFITYSE